MPLIVAENEKILDDREKLKILSEKKFTSDLEKQWLRQKLLEYKVKKGNLDELMQRMDMIPVSIALAQAAKKAVGEHQDLHLRVTQSLDNGPGTVKELHR